MLGALKDEVWFSKYESALVTRLSLGNSTFDPNVSHLTSDDGVYRRRVWGKFYSIQGLWDDFSMGNFRKLVGDNLKIATVLIIYCILFSLDKKTSANRTVDCWLWAMIEDSQSWESFL